MKVDLLLTGGKVYNTPLRKFCDDKLAIKDDKIIYLGKDPENKLKASKTIDLQGKYLIPGLIDIHMHIESSMTAPVQFAGEVIKNGVTTLVSEPHEIANVFGLEGVEAMINAGRDAVIDIFYAIPSSVPSTSSNLETTGGKINPADVEKLAVLDEILCLGEVMDNRSVVEIPDSRINKIIEAFKRVAPGKPIEGHIPNFVDFELSQLVSKGIGSDHTYHSIEQAESRLKLGVQIQIQEKSIYSDLFDFLQKNARVDQLALVTDDVMADFLVENGHLNNIVKKAVEFGYSIEEAILMATGSPAERMNLNDRGKLLPGRLADIIVLSDLENFVIDAVYKNGRPLVENGQLLKSDQTAAISRRNFPEAFYQSVNLQPLSRDDFKVSSNNPGSNSKVSSNNNLTEDASSLQIRYLEVKNDTTYTEEKLAKLPVKDNELDWENSPLAIIGVFSRYQNTSRSLGLAGGALIKEGAAATTYAHDHHNLLVVGQNKEDAVIAANWVINNNGGYCVVKDRKIQAALELPVAGILSERPVSELAEKLKEVRNALHAQGYEHYNAIMSLSTLTLPVSPKLKITDKGIIDVSTGTIKSLFI